MEIQNIKQISITDYLQQQGYSPARVQGIHFWYCSPLRNESTPSFKVNTERNQWYDFGTGEHGDIIDLVCALFCCSISEAIDRLSGAKQVAHQGFSFGGERKNSERKLEILSAQPLSSPSLLRYLAVRAIPLSVAKAYCSEVLFRNMKRTYYAIGFANDAGGWEIRNSYFKGCIVPKAITSITYYGLVHIYPLDKTILCGISCTILFRDERCEGRENHVAKDLDGAFRRFRLFLSQLVAVGIAHWKGWGGFALYLHTVRELCLSVDGWRMDEPIAQKQFDGRCVQHGE